MKSGAWCLVLGAWCLVPGAVLGAIPGARCKRCIGTGVAFAPRMVAHRYQELVAWQLANELKQEVYALIGRSAAREDRRFCDQAMDAAASAPRNLAEGFGCYRHPEFARYARIAKSSLIETHNHLGDGVDRRYWSSQDAAVLQALADRAAGACVRLVRYLETTDAPGTRRRRK